MILSGGMWRVKWMTWSTDDAGFATCQIEEGERKSHLIERAHERANEYERAISCQISQKATRYKEKGNFYLVATDLRQRWRTSPVY